MGCKLFFVLFFINHLNIFSSGRKPSFGFARVLGAINYNLLLPGLTFFITVYCSQIQYNTKIHQRLMNSFFLVEKNTIIQYVYNYLVKVKQENTKTSHQYCDALLSVKLFLEHLERYRFVVTLKYKSARGQCYSSMLDLVCRVELIRVLSNFSLLRGYYLIPCLHLLPSMPKHYV